ncbi:14763_t:CDS:2, partial [Gigaspora rosea]
GGPVGAIELFHSKDANSWYSFIELAFNTITYANHSNDISMSNTSFRDEVTFLIEWAWCGAAIPAGLIPGEGRILPSKGFLIYFFFELQASNWISPLTLLFATAPKLLVLTLPATFLALLAAVVPIGDFHFFVRVLSEIFLGVIQKTSASSTALVGRSFSSFCRSLYVLPIFPISAAF